MSESSTEVEQDVEPDIEQTDEQADTAEGEQEAPDGSRASRDAAKYRTQLREVELANNYLKEQVQGLWRREVERIAGEHLAQTSDLFDIGGVQLGDLAGDDGFIDPERVKAAATDLVAKRPGLARVERGPFPDLGGGRRGSSSVSQAAWSDVLRDRKVS